MNASVATLPASAVFTPPDWLQSCLIQRSSESDLEGTEPEPGSLTEAITDSLICRAFHYAYTLHEGQFRASGEPYIAHPVAVAGLLRDMGGSPAMIAAGFLHDVVEDTEITAEGIEERFGVEVRLLVEGVTKLSNFQFSSKTERQAENFRRMFLAMAQDIRVIVVKLADRLHNMRTLEHLADEKRRRIALETREIFAPLANRLGIGRLKWELEDLCFKYLEPESYREIQGYIADKRADRENQITQAIAVFEDRLREAGIHYTEITGRPKHLYGIYTKMSRQQKEFHEIYDIAAIRIIVQNKDDCYRSLAIVHDALRPIPGRFKDYIGLPKPNQYQSLHTVVIGNNGRPLEVQIRTLEMHHIAEYGIAAHWKYKESGGSNVVSMTADDEKFIWLRSLLEWQNDLKDPQEYIRSVKDNLFEDEVYVFTPKGDVIPLSQGATPVDFAYRIHTEVGHHCVGAKVNERIVTLDTQLRNGDIVEILTQKNSQPRLDWLSFVVSEGARNRIRQWYKRSHRDENISRGREMLEKEMGKSGFDSLLRSEPMQAVAERSNYQQVDDLLAGLGYGEITLNLVVNRIREAVRAQQPPTPVSDQEVLETIQASSASRKTESTSTTQRSGKSPILGVEGLLYDLAKCCSPIPGEPIIGAVSLGSRGIRVHRQGCQNLEQISGDRLIPLSWNTAKDTQLSQSYPVNLRVEAIDRVGILKDILSRLSDSNINVRNVNLNYSDKVAMMDLCIEIRDRDQLERTCTQIRKLSDVINLRRLSQAED